MRLSRNMKFWAPMDANKFDSAHRVRPRPNKSRPWLEAVRAGCNAPGVGAEERRWSQRARTGTQVVPNEWWWEEGKEMI